MIFLKYVARFCGKLWTISEEKMKYEIAEELGLLDKVLADGWKALSSKETGRIGGLVTKRRREEAEKQ